MAYSLARSGILFCLVGPVGSGKTSLSRALIEANPGSLKLSISATSRPIRTGETPGQSYHFVSEQEFQKRVAAGDFFEWEKVHGNYYGTLIATLNEAIKDGIDLILDIDIKGAQNFRRKYPDQAVSIFLVPPSASALRERVMARSKVSDQELRNRLNTAQQEYDTIISISGVPGSWDYLVINDKYEETLATLQAIISAERAKIWRMNQKDLQRYCKVD
ncbi:MAG: guanylate kinase [Proteobacteria bacterium]|nr:MAG: guanylate kinase [Pseudomonadota bacterium]